MIYRREIDGLRALAVVPVVLFHAGVPGFAGGYAGVDVFFVISGFLITTLLVQDLRDGRFSIVDFYERRSRRILPALVLVVAVTTLMAVLTLPPAQLQAYGVSMIATALFGANIYFWRTTDYFGTAAEERPLLHMWSLAVEEQFYIVFPLLLWVLWQRRRGGSDALLWGVFLALAGSSLVLAIVAAGWKPVANFYLPVTRAWELLAGSLVALALKGLPPAPGRFAPWLAGLGLVLVAGALVGIDDTTPWPSVWTMVPVAGTALVLAFARADCPTGRSLAWGPMVWIGLLSYSIYLWHQPLLAFARIATPGQPPLGLMVALALATVPLAWIGWRFVEQPFRLRPDRGGLSRRTILASSLAALLGITAIGAFPVAAPGLTERMFLATRSQVAQDRYRVVQEVTDPAVRAAFDVETGGACRRRFDLVTAQAEEMLLRCTENGGRAVIVAGGSHGIDLYLALVAGSDADVIIGFSRGYCRPHQSLTGPPPHACPFAGLRDLVAAHPDRIGMVIYTQAAFAVFEEGRLARDPATLRADLVEEVGDYLADLAAHVPVLMLGPKPFLGVDVRRLRTGQPLEVQIAAAQDPAIVTVTAAADRRFADAMAARGIAYLSHADAIGTVLPQEAIVDGRLTYRDNDHWSIFGATVFGARLVSALAAAGHDGLPPRQMGPFP